MKTIDTIVIHCSATREGQDVRASDIDKWHRERGFREIGYNYVVGLDGTVEVGRPLTSDGAHCAEKDPSGKSYNKHSVGICYVGGLDASGRAKDTRTGPQKTALANLVYELIKTYPITQVIGHRDASPDLDGDGVISSDEWTKQCPCFDVRSEFPVSICTARR